MQQYESKTTIWSVRKEERIESNNTSSLLLQKNPIYSIGYFTIIINYYYKHHAAVYIIVRDEEMKRERGIVDEDVDYDSTYRVE